MSATDVQFCDAFVKALYGEAVDDPTVAAIAAQAGFAVYRNTVVKACVDALAANFPAVGRLTGSAWFHAAAVEHARTTPPTSASLFDYGAAFADFLEQSLDAHALPYLAGVARIERLWMEAHLAADEPVLAAHALAALDPEALGHTVLAPHASARWTWCPDMPLASIWCASRVPDAAPAQPAWQGEGLLLTRPDGAVRCLDVGAGAVAFLDACANGAPLHEAATRTLAAEPLVDLSRMLATLLDAGAFRAGATTE